MAKRYTYFFQDQPKVSEGPTGAEAPYALSESDDGAACIRMAIEMAAKHPMASLTVVDRHTRMILYYREAGAGGLIRMPVQTFSAQTAN